MMLKLFGVILIIGAGGFAGLSASASLKKRIEFLEYYISFINQVKELIRFSGAALEQIFEKVETGSIMRDIIKSTLLSLKCGKSFTHAWEQAVSAQNKILNGADCTMLRDFGKGLGVTDIEGQLSHCSLSIEIAARRLENARNDYNAKAKLYRALGILGGATFALVII